MARMACKGQALKLFCLFLINEGKRFKTLAPGVNVIKLFWSLTLWACTTTVLVFFHPSFG
jgi:hypothetical protein